MEGHIDGHVKIYKGSNIIYKVIMNFGNVARIKNGEKELDIMKKHLFVDDECVKLNRTAKLKNIKCIIIENSNVI